MITEQDIVDAEIRRREGVVHKNKKPKGNPPKSRKPKKAKKEKIKEIKLPPTEEELVKKYAKRVMMNQRYHGRVDGEKFKGLKRNEKENKNLWLDSDFFFSVVFQSSEQKYKFLKEIGIKVYDGVKEIQIVNGLDFAESLNIELKKETTGKYPTSDIDLMPYVLDNETLNES